MLTDDCLAGPDDSGAKMASSAASQLGPGVRLVKLRTQLAPLACLVRWLADQPASAKADLLVLGSHLACHAMVPDKMEPCVWDSTAINSVDAASIAPCPVILVRAQHGAGLSPTTPTAASAAGGARGERPCHNRTVLVALDGRMPDSDFITKWSIENLIQPSDKVRSRRHASGSLHCDDSLEPGFHRCSRPLAARPRQVIVCNAPSHQSSPGAASVVADCAKALSEYTRGNTLYGTFSAARAACIFMASVRAMQPFERLAFCCSQRSWSRRRTCATPWSAWRRAPLPPAARR